MAGTDLVLEQSGEQPVKRPLTFWPTFDSTITAGNLLICVTFLASVLLAYGDLRTVDAVHEQRITRQEEDIHKLGDRLDRALLVLGRPNTIDLGGR